MTLAAKSFPEFITRSELRRIIRNCCHAFPKCRAGQAVVNTYNLPKQVEDSIYELVDFEHVVVVINTWNDTGRKG